MPQPLPCPRAARRRCTWLTIAVASALAACSSAPPAPDTGPPPRALPWQAEAPVPAPAHVSAFATYRPHVEQPVGDWRAANEAVLRAGGWRAYGREAEAPLQPLPPLGTTAAPKPASGPEAPR
jgi:hypothetical protein